MRVGGRIKNGEFDFNTKHPIILPRKSHITELIIRNFDQRIRYLLQPMKLGQMDSGLLDTVQLYIA